MYSYIAYRGEVIGHLDMKGMCVHVCKCSRKCLYLVVADITEEVAHGPEIGMKNEAAVVVTRETENLVSHEILEIPEKATEIQKKLRNHKHLHHNTHKLILILML